MLVVDSSAIIAILRAEPEEAVFRQVLGAGARTIGWPTAFECSIVSIRYLSRRSPWLSAFVDANNTTCIAFDGALEALATNAFARFGKGRHPAALNFGDCMAYAVARHLDLPLLFKGGDFGLTDVRVHPASVLGDAPR